MLQPPTVPFSLQTHLQLRKLDQRLDLMRGATRKAGGVYMYANQQGCDGNRLYYDGCACIASNGEFLAQVSASALDFVYLCLPLLKTSPFGLWIASLDQK